MFKKIQNHLLLHHPLLWNIKIVPVSIIAIILHMILFTAGYAGGGIDFTSESNNYLPDMRFGITTFFCVIIALLICIVWLVYYFRNNAFKTFYPKKSNSLYKEWLLILVVCLLNATYPLTYFWGNNIRATSYFTEAELTKRADIISMASVFAGVDFHFYNDIYDSINDVYISNSTHTYFGKEYELKSLVNKKLSSLSYISEEHDSINELRVKKWLHEGRKDSVLWLMKQFDKIVKQHHLKTALTPEKWLEITWSPPQFTKYALVEEKECYIINLSHSQGPDEYSPYTHNEGVQPDNANTKILGDSMIISTGYERQAVNIKENTVKMHDGIRYVYPKYFVPINITKNAYSEVLDAYHDRKGAWLSLLGIIYFCFTLSALIFSFRVTSGAKWLLAMVSFGVAAAVTGIVFVFISESISYPDNKFIDQGYFIFWLLIVAGLFTYFLAYNKKKSFKDIVLNILLWLMPWILPTCMGIWLETYDDYYRYTSNEMRGEVYYFLQERIDILSVIFIITHLVAMLFFTGSIKKCKGLAEA